MKKIYIAIVTFLILSLVMILGVYLLNKKSDIKTVTINKKTFAVELAKTPDEHEKGLMNRDHLDTNSGMLFIYDQAEIQTFWMKNTLIPLDIIWINKGKIVEITTLDMETPDNIPEFTPENKANYVLELNAGTATEYGLEVGDKVKMN